MSHEVVVRHNFETAHRLPNLGGKCVNLHGHSWWCEVTVSAPSMKNGTVVEFGQFKSGIRTWIDRWLDHGTMLGATDPLVAALAQEKSKIYRFNAEDPFEGERFTAGLSWPTVENVALLISRVAQDILLSIDHAENATVRRVQVDETHVNTACYHTDR